MGRATAITMLRIVAIAGLSFATTACGSDDDGGGAGDPLVARGRTIYQNVCIACHDVDPTQDGSLGPALAGASLALLEAKVLRAEYPPGYAPKRPSATMPKFTFLEEALPALAAYLAASER